MPVPFRLEVTSLKLPYGSFSGHSGIIIQAARWSGDMHVKSASGLQPRAQEACVTLLNQPTEIWIARPKTYGDVTDLDHYHGKRNARSGQRGAIHEISERFLKAVAPRS